MCTDIELITANIRLQSTSLARVYVRSPVVSSLLDKLSLSIHKAPSCKHKFAANRISSLMKYLVCRTIASWHLVRFCVYDIRILASIELMYRCRGNVAPQ